MTSLRRAVLDTLPRDRAGTSSATVWEAPLKGWNTRDPLARMDPQYARVLDNFYPTVGECQLRGGSSYWNTNQLTGSVSSLHPYGSTKLFANGGTGLYDVTAGGVATLAAVVTSSDGISVNVANSAGATFLWYANGAEVWVYDGAAWAAKTVAEITGGIAIANIVAPWVFKRKIFFIEKNTMNAWFLPTDSIQGRASKLPLNVFKLGGSLVAGATWTNDGGDGPDDYCAFITSEGEIAVYGGIDPSSSSSWELVGVYRAGRPPSRRCFAKIGGDVCVLTQMGALPLSKLTASDVLRPDIALTDAIRPTIQADLQYVNISNAQPGYGVMLHPTQNALIVNIPYLNTAYQYVLNVVTGAWCRFTGWSAVGWTTFNGELYFGTSNGYVVKAWTAAQADYLVNAAASPITATAVTAYNYFGGRGTLKHIPLLAPLLAFSGPSTVGMGISRDFKDVSAVSSYLTQDLSSFSYWDTAIWDIALWSSDYARSNNWLEVPHTPGYALSLYLQVSTTQAILSWAGTNVIVARGGLFG